jgi:hypothetical protein
MHKRLQNEKRFDKESKNVTFFYDIPQKPLLEFIFQIKEKGEAIVQLRLSYLTSMFYKVNDT